MNFEKRPMVEEEDKYTFNQSAQLNSQTGLIGYLRADMDTDGNGFFSSWWDIAATLKTKEFKDEFDEVINSLREEGDILHNRRTLANYCYSTPQSKMTGEENYYGVRIDTEKYSYLFRFNPNKGEYNVYCYCYVKEWLDSHIRAARKGIRFVNADYSNVFVVPDDGKVIIRSLDGSEEIKHCRYIDDYHVEIDGGTHSYSINLFHIHQLAEYLNETNKTCFPVGG